MSVIDQGARACRVAAIVGVVLATMLLPCSPANAQRAGAPIRVQVSGTASPFYDHVYVTLRDASIQRADGTWVRLPLQAHSLGNAGHKLTLDLDGLTTPASLATGVVPRGNYSSFRVTAAACKVVLAGQTTDVIVPSAPIQIESPFQTRATGTGGQPITISLDLDTELSLIDRQGQTYFEPVIRMTNDQDESVTLHLPEAQVADYAVAPGGTTGFALGSGGTLYRIDAATSFVTATVQVAPEAGEMDFSPSGNAIVIANTGRPAAPGNSVTIVDPNSLIATQLTVGPQPSRIEFRPGSDVAYVLSHGETTAGNQVSVINVSNPSNPQVVATIETGQAPLDVAFSDDGLKAVVSSAADRRVDIIDPVTKTVTATVTGLAAPADVAFLPGSHEAVVADTSTGSALTLVDTNTGQVISSSFPPHPCSSVLASPSGSTLYALSFSGTELLTLAKDGSLFRQFVLEPPRVSGSDLGPGRRPRPMLTVGSEIFVAGARGRLVVFDASTGQPVGHVKFDSEIKSIRHNPSTGKTTVTAGNSINYLGLKKWPGIQDPDDDPTDNCNDIDPPGNTTPVSVGDGMFGDLVVLADDGTLPRIGNASDTISPLALVYLPLSDCTFQQGPANCLTRDVCPDRVLAYPVMGNILNAFYQKTHDIYDIVLVCYGSDWRSLPVTDADGSQPTLDIQSPGAFAYHHWQRNFTRGLGEPPEGHRLDNRSPLGTSRLQSIVFMNDLGDYNPGGTVGNPSDGISAVSLLAHEVMHRFAAYADLPDPDPQDDVDATTVTRDHVHWARDFNSGGSVVGDQGVEFEDLGNGDFRVAAIESKLGEWDRYFFGYLSESEVQDSFVIKNPTFDDGTKPGPDDRYQIGQTIHGEKQVISLSEVIATSGSRVPPAEIAQKTLRIGVCLVVPEGTGPSPTVPQGDLDEIRALISNLQTFWQDQTSGKGHLVTGAKLSIDDGQQINVTATAGVALAEGDVLCLVDDVQDRLLFVDTKVGSPTYGTYEPVPLTAGTLVKVFAKPDETRVYVVDVANSAVKVVDVATKSEQASILLSGVPSSTARVPVGHFGTGANKAYLATSDAIAVIDLSVDPEQVVELITLAHPPVRDVVLSADGEALLYSQQAGTVPSRLYWTERGPGPSSGEIWRSDLDGSNALRILDNLDTPADIAVDPAGGKLYWGDLGDNALRRANLDGTSAEILYQAPNPIPGVGLHSDAYKIYWTQRSPGTAPERGVHRSDLDGDNHEHLLSDDSSRSDITVAEDLSKIYWSRSSKISRADLDGSNVEDIVSGPGGTVLKGLALDATGDRLYYVVTNNVSFCRVPRSGGTCEDVTPAGLQAPDAIDLDVPGGKMYFTDGSLLRRANLDGTSAETLRNLGSNTIAHGIALQLGPQQVTARHLVSHLEMSVDGYFDLLAAVQQEGNPNNSKQRATTSSWPPVLVYALKASAGSTFVNAFDLTTQPSFQFSALGTPDANLNAQSAADLIFSPGGELAFVAATTGTATSIRVFKTSTQQEIQSIPLDGIESVTLIPSPDGNRVFVLRPDRVSVIHHGQISPGN